MTGTYGSSTDIGSTSPHKARAAAREYITARTDVRASQATPSFDIPVIDLSRSFSDELADRQNVADQIRRACASSGFFYITCHGIPISNSSAILEQAERLFKCLPRDKKEKIDVRHSPYYHGWEPPEATSINGDSESKECFNFGYEEDLDPTGGDGQYVQIDGSSTNGNLWPEDSDLPGFYAAVKDYYGCVLQLSRHMCRLFALSLQLPESYFDHMITHPGGVGRMMFYPPSKSPASTESDQSAQSTDNIGLGAHSDYQCFTLLLCSSAPGLEILSPEGQWIVAPAVENSLIVNVGDFLMRWTNDIYRSTVHRVVNRTNLPRYSVPFFFSINYDLVIETLPSCISAGNPIQYPPINAGEYILQRLAMTKKDGTGMY